MIQKSTVIVHQMMRRSYVTLISQQQCLTRMRSSPTAVKPQIMRSSHDKGVLFRSLTSQDQEQSGHNDLTVFPYRMRTSYGTGILQKIHVGKGPCRQKGIELFQSIYKHTFPFFASALTLQDSYLQNEKTEILQKY